MQKIQEWSEGHLFGIKDDNVFSILGFYLVRKKTVSNSEEKEDSEILFNHNIIPNLPANINKLGAFVVCSSDEVNSWEKKYLKADSKADAIVSIFNIMIPTYKLIVMQYVILQVLTVDLNTHGITAKVIKDRKCDQTEFEIVDELYWKKFVCFYVKASVSLSCLLDYDSIQKEFSLLKKKVLKFILDLS